MFDRKLFTGASINLCCAFCAPLSEIGKSSGTCPRQLNGAGAYARNHKSLSMV